MTRGAEKAPRQEGRVRLPDGKEISFIHRTPEKGARGPSVILAPGMGETAEGTFVRPTEALAKRGHDVFAVTHTPDGLDDAFLEKEKARIKSAWMAAHGSKLDAKRIEKLFDAIPLTEFRKAYTVIYFIEAQIREGTISGKVAIVGHSQGGAYALIAVFLRPDLFHKVILVNPAGQSGREAFGKMFRNFHLSALIESLSYTLRTGKLSGILSDTISYLWQRGGLMFYSKQSRAMKEGRALTDFNAYEFMQALSVIAPEVDVTTVYDSADRIFRKKKIENAARIARKNRPKETMGKREPTKGRGHYSLITYPEEFAELFHDILSRPAKKPSEERAAE